MTYEELLEKNRRYLWNPFTQMKEYCEGEPLIIERAEGVKLIDVNGKEYYDGNSSVWVNPHGHNRAEINQAIIEQLDKIAHSTLLGSANVPSILLAERLVGLTPERLQKVFYSDSGATAVEVALKMAYLYWQHRGQPERQRFLSMGNAYHGDTVGAVSVGGIDRFHAAFRQLIFPVERVTYPYPYRFPGTEKECMESSLQELKEKLKEMGKEIAAVVIEPMVQGAGGLIVMPNGFLKEVERLCRQYGVLLIVDEVATGFGRTGKMFACEHEGVEPDLLCLGKKLTGGYLPVAATMASNEIYDAFWGDHAEGKTFFHGHSYTGNQLGCAAALASLELYEKENRVGHVQELDEWLGSLLAETAKLPHVGEVRRKGWMVGIELVRDRETKERYPWEEAMGARVCRHARELGMLTRPLGDVITFLPLLVSTKEELEAMVSILNQAISEVTGP
ncbi:adenosylmethionine-8-amino-7-oxononanoate aminotransferase apoenzyme [Marininema mesophilum]|uniref:Adenosylmethionine-8-amino-7-oxononanoate aminotransferase n=1 Tax=Marininema mesophilum TaxID=1048340 RepID=A0A1H2W7A1_9BACL|nr:adenosylmethionine--8-amino-7-oxononanoate transaminase [Marininema mesophilum]SDW76134.1 adenosylmethionine-8-amino-7-oxononanoate aminotransferase apoenzyme [Marininema mesophilum]